jgi:hypothetical protein
MLAAIAAIPSSTTYLDLSDKVYRKNLALS